MGNAQPIAQTPLVSRPYDAVCKDIARTFPPTFVTSYQRPREISKRQEMKGSHDCLLSETLNPRRGCCFSPKGESSSKRISVKKESFWDYGECLGDEEVNESHDDLLAQRAPSGRTTATTTTNDSEEKLSTTDTTGHSKMIETNNNLKVDQRASCSDQTVVADLMKSVERHSLVKIPLFGSPNNHKVFLEPQILDTFLPFILDATLSKCFSTCPHWLYSIYSHLRHQCQPALDSFQSMYCQNGHLEYEASTLNIQPIFTAEVAAVRVDLLIYCKVCITAVMSEISSSLTLPTTSTSIYSSLS